MTSQSLGGSAKGASTARSGLQKALDQLTSENAKLAAEADLLKQEIALAKAEGVAGGLPGTSTSPSPSASGPAVPGSDHEHSHEGGWYQEDHSGDWSGGPGQSSPATAAPSTHTSTGASGSSSGSSQTTPATTAPSTHTSTGASGSSSGSTGGGSATGNTSHDDDDDEKRDKKESGDDD